MNVARQSSASNVASTVPRVWGLFNLFFYMGLRASQERNEMHEIL